MAHLIDCWYKTINGPDDKPIQVPRPECGKGMRYRVRYVAPDGKEKSRSFPDKKKREAQAFLATVQADILKGTYVDPGAGKVTFRQYADEWLGAATCDDGTKVRLEYELRLHVYPVFGTTPLAAIQPGTIRSWGQRLQQAGLAESYRRILFNDVATIFNAAVDDKRIVANPVAAKSIRRPNPQPVKVVPWPSEQVATFREHVRDRYKVAVDLGAGCGLRQGEIFAVSPDDIDTTRRMLQVRRQIKMVRSRPVFALPKGGKVREVPLPDSVARRLADHVEEYPPTPVTLPWATQTGDLVTVPLYLYTADRQPLKRSGFNATVWKGAIKATGIEDSRRNGMHVLRHTYASVLLDAGESIKALSAYLGHTDPGFTLRVYTHLLPSSEERTRRAIDRAFGDDQSPDGMGTA